MSTPRLSRRTLLKAGGIETTDESLVAKLLPLLK